MAVISLINSFATCVWLIFVARAVQSDLICVYQATLISTLDCRPLGNNLNEIYNDSTHAYGYVPNSRNDELLTAIVLRECNIVNVLPNAFEKYPDVTSLDLSRNLIHNLLPGTFSSMKKLTLLNLSHNTLADLDSDFFNGLDELRVIDVSHNILNLVAYTGFERLPKLQILDYSWNLAIDLIGAKFGNDLQTLKLSSTAVKLYSEAFSNLASLHSLDLSSSQLFYLPEDLLKPCPNLLSIVLSSNSLLTDGGEESIGLDFFTFSTKLIDIDLSSNSLTNLTGLFTQNIKLRKLNLSKNEITTLDSDTFSSNGNMLFLDLSGNKIKRRLPANIFGNLKYLRHLDLSMNTISVIDVNIFAGNPYLESLHLNDNRLKTLDGSQFSNNKYLRRLFLAGNLLLTVLQETFENLENLGTVDLAGNRISSIPVKFFALPKMEVVILACNNLTQLPDDFFELHNSASDKKVQLDYNPWKCPCIMRSLELASANSVEYSYGMFNDGRTGFCVFQENNKQCDSSPLTKSELSHFKAKPELDGKLC